MAAVYDGIIIWIGRLEMAILRKRMFVKSNITDNNNKFWEITLSDTGAVTTRNGRVGTKGVSQVIGQGEARFESKIREKLRGGYVESDLVGEEQDHKSLSSSVVADRTESEIAGGDPVVAQLLRELAVMNKHEILQATGGKMDIDLDSGIIKTAVGVVTSANVLKARFLLNDMEHFVLRGELSDRSYMDMLEQYLMLVPQKVGAKRGWHLEFISNRETVQQQSQLLDQLESSVTLAAERVKAAQSAAAQDRGPVFDVSMAVCEDQKILDDIHSFYRNGRHENHVSRNLRITRVFDMRRGQMDREWCDDGALLPNVQRLWHGTRAHNLISILKRGLIIPRSGGSISVTGRLFGDGLYFSDQSTKSLNYSYGYWDGGRKDSRCFMLLADVAMGRSFTPNSRSYGFPIDGYDSTFAVGGRSGVINNEMIIYRTSQANPKYLVEFEL